MRNLFLSILFVSFVSCNSKMTLNEAAKGFGGMLVPLGLTGVKQDGIRGVISGDVDSQSISCSESGTVSGKKEGTESSDVTFNNCKQNLECRGTKTSNINGTIKVTSVFSDSVETVSLVGDVSFNDKPCNLNAVVKINYILLVSEITGSICGYNWSDLLSSCGEREN